MVYGRRFFRGGVPVSARVLKQGELRCPVCGKPRYAIESCCAREICCDANEDQTFWNYEPTPARIVRVIVGPSERETWWCAKLVGTEREAVEVNYHGDIFYLDNEDGSGWGKVTGGRGGPEWGHSSLPVERVLEPQA
jgi:hypothetical protein